MNAVNLPSRQQVHEILLDLIGGRRSREEVAGWASTWIQMDNPDVNDPIVWGALKELAGADLRTNPIEYLHTETDFQEWLDRMESGG